MASSTSCILSRRAPQICRERPPSLVQGLHWAERHGQWGGATVEVRRLRGLGVMEGEGQDMRVGTFPQACASLGAWTHQRCVRCKGKARSRYTAQTGRWVRVRVWLVKPHPNLSSSMGLGPGDISIQLGEATRVLAYLGQQGAPLSLLHPPPGQACWSLPASGWDPRAGAAVSPVTLGAGAQGGASCEPHQDSTVTRGSCEESHFRA